MNDEPADGPQIGGFPSINNWNDPGLPDPGGGPGYGPLIEALRSFLDAFAAANPDTEAVRRLTEELSAWRGHLAATSVSERQQIFGHRHDLPGRGQTMSPCWVVESGDVQQVRGRVRFGRFYLGGNGAVHGGAIPLLFDEVLGQLANSGGRARARTAFLHVDFRSITPIEKTLQVRGWFVREEGRKRLLRAELRNGAVLCAEAEGLFVALKPGQP